LARRLDTGAPDRDSRRLGALTRLSLRADELHTEAARQNRLESAEYKLQQEGLFAAATRLVQGPK